VAEEETVESVVPKFATRSALQVYARVVLAHEHAEGVEE
jgi:hypothetical protein